MKARAARLLCGLPWGKVGSVGVEGMSWCCSWCVALLWELVGPGLGLWRGVERSCTC